MHHIEYRLHFRDMMLYSAMAVLLHTSVVLGAFSQTRRASRTQPSQVAQDDYAKQPQMQKPLEPEELQELEDLIGSLSTDQLEELQAIMDRDHDEVTEFDLISGELAEMGVEEEDIADLKLLGSMMHKFLVQVPDIEIRLEMKKPHDLMDHVQLYLLGLPNKLGPLGFLALHHVLTEEEEADVVKVNAK